MTKAERIEAQQGEKIVSIDKVRMYI
jgi:hypothetical protein